jgi:hypothetical protein
MNIIRKCKAILRIKSKSNFSVNVKDRAIAVFEQDLRQAKSEYAEKKFNTEQYLDDSIINKNS